MYEISKEEYFQNIKDLARDEINKIRQEVYESVYELVASHVSEPNEHEDLVDELLIDALLEIKDQL